MSLIRNIIVTGCNKGIGSGIVQKMARKPNWNIIMACRNIQLANQTRDQLAQKYPDAKLTVEQLDVSDQQSIQQFIPKIQQKYRQIDVLLNNAGANIKNDAISPDIFKLLFATNFYGTISLSEKMLPLIRDQGKIISLGSMAGNMAFRKITNQELKKRFKDENLSREQLFSLMKEYETAIQNENWEQNGWPKWTYGISKLGIGLYMRILSKQKEVLQRGIQVYSCCPGYVSTDMTGHKGPLTIEQGAMTPTFLVQLPFELNEKYQGNFFERSALSKLCP